MNKLKEYLYCNHPKFLKRFFHSSYMEIFIKKTDLTKRPIIEPKYNKCRQRIDLPPIDVEACIKADLDKYYNCKPKNNCYCRKITRKYGNVLKGE